MKATQGMFATNDCSASIKFLVDLEHISFVLHCIYPCVPSLVVNKNNTVAVSSKGRMLVWPKEIKVNDLQGMISVCWIGLGLIHIHCFPLPHIGTNIAVSACVALRYLEGLPIP
jgi:hypothetical protein